MDKIILSYIYAVMKLLSFYYSFDIYFDCLLRSEQGRYKAHCRLTYFKVRAMFIY